MDIHEWGGGLWFGQIKCRKDNAFDEMGRPRDVLIFYNDCIEIGLGSKTDDLNFVLETFFINLGLVCIIA